MYSLRMKNENTTKTPALNLLVEITRTTPKGAYFKASFVRADGSVAGSGEAGTRDLAIEIASEEAGVCS